MKNNSGYWPARVCAAYVITDLLQARGSITSRLPLVLDKAHPDEKAFISQLVYGTCRYFPRLSLLAEHLLNRPIEPEYKQVYALLLVGLYELDYLHTADYAAVTNTVEASKALRVKNAPIKWASSLCNWALRHYLREKDTLIPQLNQNPVYEHNQPDWLIAKLSNYWPQEWHQLPAGLDEQGPMTLRVNVRHHTRDEYLALLTKASIDAAPCQYSPWGIQLTQPCHVDKLPGFDQGWVSVQDEAGQLVPLLFNKELLNKELLNKELLNKELLNKELLNKELLTKPSAPPSNPPRVLDACAAPGGKTGHLLEVADISLTAIELEDKRMGRLHDNLARLQLKAKVICADANRLDDWWDGHMFDYIVLDAPCSGTGVIRRHPDIKMLRTNASIVELANQQLTLLQSLWASLKVGGQLLYVTCSILKQENERVIERFMQTQTDAHLEPIHLPVGIARPTGIQLLPKPQGHDGFFFAKLVKK